MHGQLGIEARTFIAHKGVLVVEFVPGEMDAGLCQRAQNEGAAFAGLERRRGKLGIRC